MGISRAWLIGMVAIVVCALLPVSARATGPSLNEQLLRAAENGSSEQVKSLLAKGADVNAKTRIGITVLMAAVRTGNLDLVKYLVHKGANVSAKNQSGLTALSADCAANKSAIRRFLRARGAK